MSACAIGMAGARVDSHPFAGHVERINKIWLQKARKTNKRNELKPARARERPSSARTVSAAAAAITSDGEDDLQLLHRKSSIK